MPLPIDCGCSQLGSEEFLATVASSDCCDSQLDKALERKTVEWGIYDPSSRAFREYCGRRDRENDRVGEERNAGSQV